MENTPLQTLLDERAQLFDEKFPEATSINRGSHFEASWSLALNTPEIKSFFQESILQGVRLGREEVIDVISRAKSYVPVEDNLFSRFGHKLLEAILKETAALEAKEKELGV